MRRWLLTLLLTPALVAWRAPGPEVGDWSCTHYAPGPGIGSLGYTMVMRFSLLADGSYRAGTASGRYRFDALTGAITFVDGELSTLYADTQLRPSKAGGYEIITKINNRRFECHPRKTGGGNP